MHPLPTNDNLSLTLNELNDHIVQSRFGSVQFNSLNSTAYFVYLLSKYADSKQYSGLKWLVEICALVYSCGEKINWKEVELLCAQLSCQMIFYLMREVVAEMIGTMHPAFKKWYKNKFESFSAEDISEFMTLLNYPGLIPKYLNSLLFSAIIKQQQPI
jgi:hypothetical protein